MDVEENGELLRAAQHEFDVLVTMDRGMEFQRNLADFDLADFDLADFDLARGNLLKDSEPLVEATMDAA
jgi:hypothetical protein